MGKVSLSFFLTILLLALAASSCSLFEPGPQILEKGADIRGEITHLTRVEKTGVVVIRVESEIQPDTKFDQVDVSVKKTTKVYVKRDQGYAPGSSADLATGQTVEALFVGPIAERYPYQATASEVIVVKDKD